MRKISLVLFYTVFNFFIFGDDIDKKNFIFYSYNSNPEEFYDDLIKDPKSYLKYLDLICSLGNDVIKTRNEPKILERKYFYKIASVMSDYVDDKGMESLRQSILRMYKDNEINNGKLDERTITYALIAIGKVSDGKDENGIIKTQAISEVRNIMNIVMCSSGPSDSISKSIIVSIDNLMKRNKEAYKKTNIFNYLKEEIKLFKSKMSRENRTYFDEVCRNNDIF